MVSKVFSSLPARPKRVRAGRRGTPSFLLWELRFASLPASSSLASLVRRRAPSCCLRLSRVRASSIRSVLVPERDAEVLADVDVVVAGGGPAGLGAAIAAARLGARVALCERYGFLG